MEQRLVELVPMPVLGKLNTEQRKLLRVAFGKCPRARPLPGKEWTDCYTQMHIRGNEQLVLWYNTDAGSTKCSYGPIAG